jgi:2-iminobutanoate/2-iminopropanoate deaminase
VKKVIATENAPAAVGPYSQAVVAGDYMFIAGQLGIDPATGKLVDGGVERQTAQALDNIEAILEAAGAGLDAVVKTTVLLQHMGDFAVMNGAYGPRFRSAPPARAAFEVAKLPLGALVEIEAVAYLG